MKTFKTISLAIITLLFFQSCDEVEELTSVDISTDIVKQVTITTNQGGDFEKTLIFNLSDSSEVEKYLDHIEGVKIARAHYKVVAFPGDLFVAGTVSVVSENQIFGPFTHNNFENDFENETVFNLEGVEKLNIIATKLKNTKQVSVTISGTAEVDQAFTMTLEVGVGMVVTAQAL